MLNVSIIQGYMLISRNAEGLHGQRKFGNPCAICTQPLEQQTGLLGVWTGNGDLNIS